MATVLLDINNLFSRCKYAIKESNSDLYVSLIANGLFSMIKDVMVRFKPDKYVAFCDGNGSWRKLIYPQYKANRNKDKTLKEQEQDEIAMNFLRNEFIPFLKNDTYMPVIDGDLLEADDLIATYTYMFPEECCIICSTDGDFLQLLNDKICLYNSMENRVVTNKGVYDTISGKKLAFTVKDGKIHVGKEIIYVSEGERAVPMDNWIDYCLFVKCIRGDRSDNILSAYPRVPEKSSKNKIGLLEAFVSKTGDGFAYNSMMNSTWKDLLGNEHLVQHDFAFNQLLIDLRQIPSDLRNSAVNIINAELNKDKPQQIYKKILHFFNKFGLERLAENIDSITKPFILGSGK